MRSPGPGSALLDKEKSRGRGGIAVSVEDPASNNTHDRQDEDDKENSEGVRGGTTVSFSLKNTELRWLLWQR